jgi:hypothetical protein
MREIRSQNKPCRNCGHTVKHYGRGLCRSCYHVLWRAGRLTEYPLRPGPPKSRKTVRYTVRVGPCQAKGCGKSRELPRRNLCRVCYNRYRRKGILSKAPATLYGPWTAAEIATVRTMRRAGKTYPDCAAALGSRTADAVRKQCRKHGIIAPVSFAKIGRATAELLARRGKGMPGYGKTSDNFCASAQNGKNDVAKT